jgi:PAS domain S-box-containing protein
MAVTERRAIYTGDYLHDTRFRHAAAPDAFVAAHDIRSALAAPLLAEGEAFGTLTVYTSRDDAFDNADAALIEALAHQAAIAITNARLIDELNRSREELARRADSERALRQITARLTAIREPAEVLDRIVEESKRLLGSDGAHLTLMSDDRTNLRPVVVAGGLDEESASWLRSLEFPINGGMNGLAAGLGEAVWTSEYEADPRIPHGPGDEIAARRLALVAMAVAPLRGPDGEVVGTLAISYAEPRQFTNDEIELLQGFADQAAIALTNSRLLERLGSSEARYRYLVKASPDVIWAVDPDGRFTFMSDRNESLTGFTPEEVVGRTFADFTDEASLPAATAVWEAVQRDPTGVYPLSILARHKDGDVIPVEVWVTGMVQDGQFAGAHGSIRDMRERERLERELRSSEEAYRHLVQNSPDLIWSVDADGRFTFLSDTSERLSGWRPDELFGKHFGALVHPSSPEVTEIDWTKALSEENRELRGRLNLLHKDGRAIPAEFIAMTSLDDDGTFAGANGSVRDMTERDRLERELRESEGRYRFLVENSPDVVFSIDAEGRFTFLSDTIERLTGITAAELVGQHFSASVEPDSMAEAAVRWQALIDRPALDQVVKLRLQRRDGSSVPVEVSAIGMTDGAGTFAGIHGSTRDVSERERLERDLLSHASALASSEERAHLARELHDSVTQALFSMTLLTRTIELLMARDPAAAAEKLSALRDLQRDALAEMRALIFELRPGSIEQDGLVKALRTHTAALEGRIGLPIVLEADLFERLPIDLEETLYRIAQESLHNIVKHAAAQKVWLRLERSATTIKLTVEDDGVGFDPGRVPDGHLGVAGMRARADRIGARFSIDSRPGSGTRIEVVAPISESQATAADAQPDRERIGGMT